MPIEILMPAASPTMEKGNISKWVKKEGDKVKFGDVILEIETDKATMEVECNDEGILGKIIHGDSSKDIKVNEIIAYIRKENESQDDFEKAISSLHSNVSDSKPQSIPEKKESKTTTSNDSCNSKSNSDSDQRVKISPLAKKIAQNEGIDYIVINGTGPAGRIVKKDIENFKPEQKSQVSHSCSKSIQSFEDIKIPNSSMRKAIATRLSQSKHQSPHFYLSIECDITNLLKIREKINKKSVQDENGNHSHRISVNDFVVMASSKALVDYPKIKTTFYEDHILQYGSTDISVAMSIEDGLITPIVKNANNKSLIEISNEIKSLAKKAKTNSLKPNEFSGGCFTISNLGMFNVQSFFAIINPPQSAILAVGVSNKKPVYCEKENNFFPRDIMNLSLSVDHRSIDGVYAAKFLNSIKDYLENIEFMLL